MVVTIYGVCAVSFMMAMYALERRSRATRAGGAVLAAMGCALENNVARCGTSSERGNVQGDHTGARAYRAERVAGLQAGVPPTVRT